MKYPSVNYIGNKEKIVDWIASLIPAEATTFFDVFAGGCSVSYKAKSLGLRVYSNDILAVNYHIANALIANNNETLTDEDLEMIFEGDPFDGFTFKNYSNVYYFPGECRDLDLIRNNISKLPTSFKQSLAFALMRRSMIRKMPYSRFTIRWEKIVELRDEELSYAKYGRRRAYHNKSFRFHFEDNLQEYNDAVFDNQQQNRAFNLDVYEAIRQIDADVIYLDPPYAGTMNDYFAFYGFIDSFINQRKAQPFPNNFIDKKTIRDQFNELFSRLLKYRYWIMSYNSRSTPSKDDMLRLLKYYADDVTVHEMPYAYRVTGKEKKHNDTEYLFIVDTHI